MHSYKRSNRAPLGTAWLLSAALVGCNGLPGNTVVTTPGPQTYMAPVVAQSVSGPTRTVGNSTVFPGSTLQLAAVSLDDTPGCSLDSGIPCFSISTTSFTGTQQGTETNYAGTVAVLPRGLRSLSTTFALPLGGGAGVNYTPPQAGSYALELTGQTGGLLQLLGEPAIPLVATSACPSLDKAQTFQFITLPAAVTDLAPGTNPLTWNPALETAYGSASVSTSGDKVSFSNVRQFTLPANGAGPGTPVAVAPSGASSGICTSTPYGNTTVVPGTLTVTNPGNGQSVTPAATLGISSSGLLVESNFISTGSVAYNPILGAGTGAVGLPQPAQALGAAPVSASGTSPEYLGFLYGTGNRASGASSTGWTSNMVSFGFPQNLQSTCDVFAAQTGALANGTFGGDFPVNPSTMVPDPTASNTANPNSPYGNCNLAVDLGKESSASAGLYEGATIWVGNSYAGNTSPGHVTYSFPAVAIAGMLNGKLAIFVIGSDPVSSPKQAWILYLLRSN